MAKIRILPEILSNKIAAGEVVERPASVVKELLENALDAGSRRIVVDIEKGGRSLIRVSDDGEGMGFDDALLSVERYATSKIAKDPDLFSIHTLGFRGEALPSIASVSRMTIITRQLEEEMGGKIDVKGGVVVSAEPCGAPRGTMVSVRSLFFNTPARRKFLKGEQTEMGHIGDTVSQMAMGWPGVHFRLAHNGKSVKALSAAADPMDRVADILGREVKNDLVPLSFADGKLKITGWIGRPRQARSTTRGIYIYVNSRFIKDRTLTHGLLEGYRGRLVKGRYPLAVLFISVPYEEVDVNVHPAKHEVRFARHRWVHDMLVACVEDALRHHDRPQVPRDEAAEPPFPSSFRKKEGEAAAAFLLNDSPREKKEETAGGASGEGELLFSVSGAVSGPAVPSGGSEILSLPDRKTADLRFPPSDGPEMTALHGEPKVVERGPKKASQLAVFEERFFTGLHIIGQFRKTYIVCESERGILLIDQHAAHERISYERLKKKGGERGVASQGLVIPESVELSFREAECLESLLPELKAHGLEVAPFGGTTFLVTSVPLFLIDLPMGSLLRKIAEKAADMERISPMEEILDACLVLMACHRSIRARQQLSLSEMLKMLSDLDGCDNPYNCPHGRPTYIEWSMKEVEKNFHRIV